MCLRTSVVGFDSFLCLSPRAKTTFNDNFSIKKLIYSMVINDPSWRRICLGLIAQLVYFVGESTLQFGNGDLTFCLDMVCPGLFQRIIEFYGATLIFTLLGLVVNSGK